MADENNHEPAEYTRLMDIILEAEGSLKKAREAESIARRASTQLENALNEANKAFVDYLTKHKPGIVNEIRGIGRR